MSTDPATVLEPVDGPRAIYFRDGDYYHPTELATGPWGPYIAGPNLGGLLATVIEREAGEDTMLLARLTVDLPTRVAVSPVTVTTTVQREGSRIRLVDAVMSQDGVGVAYARAVFMAQHGQPENTVWSSPVSMPPLPAETSFVPAEFPMRAWAFNAAVPDPTTYDFNALEQHGQKFVWLCFTVPLVHGEAVTPLARAAMTADATNVTTHYGTRGLHFINVDYTMTLVRPPEGPLIGLAGMTHYSDDGVASGTATMFDERGPIGTTSSMGIANRGFPRTGVATSSEGP